MDAITIVLLILLVIVLVSGPVVFAIGYKRVKNGKKSIIWEEVKDETKEK